MQSTKVLCTITMIYDTDTAFYFFKQKIITTNNNNNNNKKIQVHLVGSFFRDRFKNSDEKTRYQTHSILYIHHLIHDLNCF